MEGHLSNNQRTEDLSHNWGHHVVRHVLYPFAVIAAPAFLLALLCYFVASAFIDGGISAGIRSLAAALIPLMVMTFLIQYNRTPVTAETKPTVSALGRVPGPLAFFVALAVGMAVMGSTQLSTTIPVGELVASGAFSVLVGSFVLLDRDRAMTYYFGFIIGVLLFITVLGGNV